MKTCNKLDEVKKWLKRTLKKKVSINDKTIIAIMIAGFFVMNNVSPANTQYIAVKGPGNQASATGNNAIAIGAGTKSEGQNAVVIGKDVSVDVENSFVLGSDNKVTQSFKKTRGAVVVIGSGTELIESKASIAIGAVKRDDRWTVIKNAAWTASIGNMNKIENGTDIVALGNNIKIEGEGEKVNTEVIAIGNNAKATKGEKSIIVGAYAEAESEAKEAVIIGHSAKAESNATGAVALGKGAIVKTAAGSSIALGYESEATSKIESKSDAKINDVTFKFKDEGSNTPKTVLSIGKLGSERIINHVAAGEISQNSTQAINGSQLYSVADVFSKLAVNVLGAQAENGEFKKSKFNVVKYNGVTTQDTDKEMTFRDAINENIKAINKGIVVKAGTGTGAEKTINLGDTIEFATKDSNLSVVLDTSNKITYRLANALTGITSIGADNNSKLTFTKENNNIRISGVADATSDNDAVNYKQLKANKLHYVSIKESGIPDENKVNKDNDGAKGYVSIALGVGASVTDASADEATAIGYDSRVGAKWSTALGAKTKIDSIQSLALGYGTKILDNADASLAIGLQTTQIEKSKWTTAIGNNINVTNSGNNIVALGSNLKIGNANDDLIVIGNGGDSPTEITNAKNSIIIGKMAGSKVASAIAIGENAQAEAEGSIALGKDSKAKAQSKVEDNATITVNGKNIKFATFKGTGENKSVLSIGDEGKERIIQNVAAGEIGQNSTQAINGSQLYSVADIFSKLAVNVLGAEAEDGENKTGFKTPTFTAVQYKDSGNTAKTTFKGAIDETIIAINKGLQFAGNTGTAFTSKLGDTVTIKGEDNSDIASSVNNGTITLTLNKATSVDDNSDKAVTSKAVKTAIDAISSKITGATITYKSNGSTESKEVALSKGFNFTNGTNTKAEIDVNGVVKYSLNNNLVEIDSISSGKDAKGGKISFVESDSVNKEDVKDKIELTLGTAGGEATKFSFSEKGLDLGTKQIINLASGLDPVGGTNTKLDELLNLQSQQTDKDKLNRAVNVADLRDIAKGLVDKGLTIEVNGSTNTVKRKLGDTLKIVGSGSNAENITVAENNIKVSKNTTNDGIEIGLSKKLTGIESIANKDTMIELKNETATNGSNTKSIIFKTGINNDITLSEGKFNGVSEIGKDNNVNISFDNTNSKENIKFTVGNTDKATLTFNKDGLDLSSKQITGLSSGIGTDTNNEMLNKILNGSGYEAIKNNAVNIEDLSKVAKELKENAKSNLAGAKIKYKANSSAESKEVALSQGFNFTNGTNTKAEIGENGVVKYSLNNNLVEIDSISNGKDAKGGKISFVASDSSKNEVKDKIELTLGTDTGNNATTFSFGNAGLDLAGKNITKVQLISNGTTTLTLDDSKKAIKLGNVSVSVNNDKKVVIGHDSKSESESTLAIGNNAIIGTGSKGSISIASVVGSQNSKIHNSEWSISIGNNNHITGGNDILALGSNVSVQGANNKSVLAIGNGTKVTNGKESIAIGVAGETHISQAEWAVAIGNKIKLTGGNDILAVGSNIDITGSNNGSLVVLGNGAKASEAQGSIVIGKGAESKVENSIALGSESKVTAKVNAEDSASITVEGKNIKFDSFKGIGDNKSVLSIGDVNKERIIQNVASGKISADSTQAINGSQLYSVAEAFSKLAVNVLGVDVADDKGFKKSSFTKLSGTTTEEKTFKQAIEDNIAKLNSGYVYNADIPSNSTTKHYLGSTISFKRLGNITDQIIETDYVGKNLITKYTNNNGGANIEIGFKDSPTFKNITLSNVQTYNNTVSNRGNEVVTQKYLEEALDNFKIKVKTNGTEVAEIGRNGTIDFTDGQNIRVQTPTPKPQPELKETVEEVPSSNPAPTQPKPTEAKVQIGTTEELEGIKSIEIEDENKATSISPEGIQFLNADGAILGLADLNDESDLTSAVNKKYVDEKIKSTNIKAPADGGIQLDTAGQIKNVTSGLGLKDTDYNKDPIYDNRVHIKTENATSKTQALVYDNEYTKKEKLQVAATVQDLQAIAVAGLKFSGNEGDEVHKKLSDRIIIKGEEDKKDISAKTNFKSAAGNIVVVSPSKNSVRDNNEVQPDLVVKLSETLKNMKGIEFEEGTGVISGLKDLEYNDPGHYAANKNYVDKAISGVANAVAMANLVQSDSNSEYRHQLGAGYGTYGNEHAIALGISGVSENGKVVYQVSSSLNNRGNVAAGIGLGYKFGKKNQFSNENTKKLAELKKENEANKVEIENLKKLVNGLKDAIKDANKDAKLYTINQFDFGKSELTKAQIIKLKAIVKEINEKYSDRTIDITGFSDITGKEAFNLDLGLDRANKVTELMIEFGLKNPQNIRKVSSYGYNNSVSKTSQLNRRVEIEIK